MATSSQFLPSIGMKGTWSLKSPFDLLVMSTTQYTCVKVESLAASEAAGDDPYTNIYQRNNASQSDYDNDIAANAFLVTLTSDTGDVVVFPNTAIVSIPDTDGVSYRNLVMSVALGPIPDSMDLLNLENEVKTLVLGAVGVKSSVYFTQRGGMTVLTTQQSTSLENYRTSVMNGQQSNAYQLMMANAQITSLQQKIRELESYIKKQVGITT